MKQNLHFKKIILAALMLLVFSFSYSQNAGPDQTGCTSTFTLAANNPSEGSGQWTVVSGTATFTDITLYNTEVTASRGDNILRWSITVGATTTYDDVTISNDMPSVANAGSDQTICSNQTIFQATNPIIGQGSWSSIAGMAVIDDFNSNKSAVYSLSPGYNTFRWTVTNNACQFFDDVTIYNNSPNVWTGYYHRTCEDSYTLSGSIPIKGEETGIWTVIEGEGVIIENPTQYNTNIYNLPYGNSEFRWTVTNQYCSAFANERVKSLKVYANAGEDINVCVVNTNLNGNDPSPNIGVWTVISGTTNVDNPNLYNSTIELIGNPAIIEWTVYNAMCSDSDQVTITNNSFVANAGADQQVTVSIATMEAELDEGATGTWSVVGGNGVFVNSTSPVSTVNNLGYGINSYRWTVTNNSCTDYDDVQIIYDGIDADAGQDISTCFENLNLNASATTVGSGIWTLIDGTGIFAEPDNPATGLSNVSSGINIYRWTVSINGYSEYDELTVTNNSFTISAGVDLTSCGDMVTLNAENPSSGSGIWTVFRGEGIFADNTLYNTEVNNVSENENEYIWTVLRNGCTSPDTITVIFQELPVVNFAASPTSQTYPNATVNIENLSNHGYEFYKWDFGDGNTRLDNSRVENFAHTYDNWGEYDITLIGGSESCSDTTRLSIEILDPSTSIERLSKAGIKIYPNPSNGKFSIEFENNLLPDKLIITNLTGQTVYYNSELNSKETIDLSENSSGVYIISIKKGEEIIRVKLLVSK